MSFIFFFVFFFFAQDLFWAKKVLDIQIEITFDTGTTTSFMQNQLIAVRELAARMRGLPHTLMMHHINAILQAHPHKGEPPHSSWVWTSYRSHHLRKLEMLLGCPVGFATKSMVKNRLKILESRMAYTYVTDNRSGPP